MKENTQDNRRILIIDDSEAIHQDLLKVLGVRRGNCVDVDAEETAFFGGTLKSPGMNFEIDSAYQGQEGLEKVRQASQRGLPSSCFALRRDGRWRCSQFRHQGRIFRLHLRRAICTFGLWDIPHYLVAEGEIAAL